MLELEDQNQTTYKSDNVTKRHKSDCSGDRKET